MTRGSSVSGLLTDLYELTMAAGYFEAGRSEERATFELSVRRLPPNRNFIITAGLAQAVEYLMTMSFTEEDIRYLRSLPQFVKASQGFFDRLRQFRFTGDLYAVPEGTPIFAGEPMLTVRGPLIEAQIVETYLLSTITFQSLIATKANRIVETAQGRGVVEFGSRRAHSPQAGPLAARGAYIGGCIGTSNVLSGFRYGVPVFGTAAHSWVLAFADESAAFRQLQNMLGESTIYIVDTYDTLQGTRTAADLGRPLWGVRLDSGDLLELSRGARAILDSAGLREAKIMASGDLDEYKIRQLVQAGAPIDVFGVGSELATSADAPRLGAVYKLVELEAEGMRRYTTKLSEDKMTYPAAKQVFRHQDRDEVACSWEYSSAPAAAKPLLHLVLLEGKVVEPLPHVSAVRAHAEQALGELPPGCRRLESPDPYRVEYSRALIGLAERTRTRFTQSKA